MPRSELLFPSFVVYALLLFGLVVIVGTPFLIYKVRKLLHLARSGMGEIDRMRWQDFEECLELMFFRLGYEVRRTPSNKDWGADLVLTLHGIKTAVQAKQRASGRVGVTAVREVVAAKEKYECSGAMVITNRSYTGEALVLAKANRVAMWDRDKLAGYVIASRVEKTRRGSAAPTSSNAGGAICTTCGTQVSERVRDYCMENSKRFGGRIYCMHHQRTAANIR